MRLGHASIGVTILRILVGSLAAVVLGTLLACGQPGDETIPTASSFDLLESGFHQSIIEVSSGERVEVSVDVRQEKHDQHICGAPSVVDPFGNVIQMLTPWQNTARETEGHYVYESRYAFIAATDGEYAVKLENRGCLLDEVAAVATVRWTVYPVQE